MFYITVKRNTLNKIGHENKSMEEKKNSHFTFRFL